MCKVRIQLASLAERCHATYSSANKDARFIRTSAILTHSFILRLKVNTIIIIILVVLHINMNIVPLEAATYSKVRQKCVQCSDTRSSYNIINIY